VLAILWRNQCHENAKPVCRQTVTTDSSCVNLDALVPEYILEIPVDPLETNPNLSGYKIYRLPGGLDLIQSDHLETCE
jgi:hypothetical protein